MALPENPFAEVLDALWRKIDDSPGSDLLRDWAHDHNPDVGLTTFRVDDEDGSGFPRSINSTESPAIHIGVQPSNDYGWAVTRSVELTELYTLTGAIASRNQRDRERFLWLVLRALWYDYPRLLDHNGQPLAYVKRWQVTGCNRGVELMKTMPFWKFSVTVQAVLCFDLTAIMNGA